MGDHDASEPFQDGPGPSQDIPAQAHTVQIDPPPEPPQNLLGTNSKDLPFLHQHYELVWNEKHEIKQWHCRYCSQKYSRTTGHSTLTKHYKSFHTSKQISIKTFLQRPAERVIRPFEDALSRFVLLGQHAFAVVEDPHFRELLASLKEDVSIPSRRTLMRNFKKELERVTPLVLTRLQNALSKIHLTTDLWTSCRSSPYIGVTAHYIDHDHKLRYLLIAFEAFPYPHTGERIGVRLRDILSRLNIRDQAHCLTTDNASNNITAINTLSLAERPEDVLNLTHIRCFAHVLNLVVREALKHFNEDIELLRTFVSYIKSSSKRLQALEETAKSLSKPFLRPSRDVATRWNSTYIMVEKALRMKDVLKSLVAIHDDFKEYVLPEDFWQRLEKVLDFFKPFNDVTVALSGSSYASLSMVIPCYEELVSHCHSRLRTSSGGCEDYALQKLRDYRDLIVCDTGALATLLDPRFKSSHFSKRDRSRFENVLKDMFERERPQSVTFAQPDESSIMSSIFKKRRVDSSHEISKYLRSDLEDKSADPLRWWSERSQSVYPVLSKLALNYLSVPATSVPSEQVFSKAGELITERRNRLDHETISMSMLLGSYTSFLDKK